MRIPVLSVLVISLGATSCDPGDLDSYSAPSAEPEQVASTTQALGTAPTPLPSAPSPADPLVPAPLPGLSTTEIGKTPGRFDVGSDGAATYSVPLEVPPGRNGLEPSLKLEYNSRRRNGLTGVGWSLSGAGSVIAPCPRDMTQPEGYVARVTWTPATDLLCLDGQRLLLTNGKLGTSGTQLYGQDRAEYRTERDSFSRIVQNGTPATSFTVHTKSGRILTYGTSAACPTCNGKPAARNGSTRAWLLTETRDRFGNLMLVSWTNFSSSYVEDYDQDGSSNYTGPREVMEFFPASIKYTGKSGQPFKREVVFGYEDRADKSRGFVAGIRSERTRRLSSVKTYVEAQQVRGYILQYAASPSTGNSLLARLNECAAGVCKPTTSFEYSAGVTGFLPAVEVNISAPPLGLPAGGSFPATPLPLIAMDVNDDGRSDLVYPTGPAKQLANTTSYRWTVLKMGPTGMNDPARTVTVTPVPATWPFAAVPLDYNQDGKMDLLLLDSGASWRVLLANSTATGLTAVTLSVGKSQAFIGTGEDAIENFPRFTRVADLNGDGAPDLLACESNGGNFRWSYRFHTGSAFGPVAWIPAGLGGTQDCRSEAVGAQMIDTDGDGATELVFAAAGQATYQAVFFNRPTNLALTASDTRLPSSVPGEWRNNRLRVIDINHDGLMDIMTGMNVASNPFAATIRYWLNMGDRFAGGLSGYPAMSNDFGQYSLSLISSVLIDHDGDGSNDLLVDGELTATSGCGAANQPACPPVRSGNFEVLMNEPRDVWPPQPKLTIHDTGISLLCRKYPRGHARPRVLDANGDLLPDLVYVETTAGGDSQTNPCSGFPGQFMIAQHRAGAPDLLVKVRDGMAGVEPTSSAWSATTTARINYAPSPSASVYLDEIPGLTRSGCVYPVSCAKPKLMLVVDAYEDRGEGVPSSHTSFQYYDARLNKTGRGFLGFGQRRLIDAATGTTTTLRYDNFTSRLVNAGAPTKLRRYPFAGSLLQATSDVVAANGTHLVFSQTFHHTEVVGPPLWPYPTYSYSSTYADREEETSLEGTTLLTRTLKTFVRDSFGNETCSTVDRGDGTNTCASHPQAAPTHDWVTVLTTFTNNTTDWLIGQATETLTIDAVGQNEKTRRVARTFFSGTGALRTRTVEPNTPAQLVKDTFAYDAFGNVTSTTTTAGTEVRTESTVYDSEGVFAARSTNAAGHVTRASFDRGLGVPLTTVDPNGLVSQFQYDGFGRLRRTVKPDGVATDIDYLRRALPDARYAMSVSSSTAGGPQRTTDYDRLGRTIKVQARGFDGANVVTTTSYERKGKVASRTLPAVGATPGGTVSYAYDNLNRLIRTTHADGSFTRMEYRGLEVDSFDEANVRNTYTTGARGQTVKVETPVNTLTYAYGPFGTLNTLTNLNGHVISISSDNYGRALSVADPSAGMRKYAYDAFGQLVSATDATNVTLKYTWDKLGRLTLRTDAEGSAAVTYDTAPKGVGKVAVSERGPAGGAHRQTYAYDTLSRVARIDHDIAGAIAGQTGRFTQTFSFSASGRLEKEGWTTPDTSFLLGYGYDAYGNLKSIKDAQSALELWTAVSVNASGQLTDEQFYTGYHTVRGYDPARGWLTSVATPGLQSLSYEHDDRGNLMRRVDNVAGIAQRFTYSVDEQLTGVRDCPSLANPCSNETLTRSYRYDSIGNMVHDNVLGAHVYDPVRPQLMTSAGGSAYGYDLNGNTVERAGQKISYTSFGKIKQVLDGSSTTDFQYDARDRRVLKITPSGRTVSVGPLEREDVGGKVSTRLQLQAGRRTVGAITKGADGKAVYSFFHSDHLGSANVTTTMKQGLVSFEKTYAFDPFGQSRLNHWQSTAVSALLQPMAGAGFTSHRHDDDLGLIDMGGRMYDPKIGRLLTADPVVSSPFTVRDLNRFSYAWNNPLRVTDPTGNEEEDEFPSDEGDFEDGPEDTVTQNPDGSQSHEFGDADVYGASSRAPEDPSQYGADDNEDLPEDDFPEADHPGALLPPHVTIGDDRIAQKVREMIKELYELGFGEDVAAIFATGAPLEINFAEDVNNAQYAQNKDGSAVVWINPFVAFEKDGVVVSPLSQFAHELGHIPTSEKTAVLHNVLSGIKEGAGKASNMEEDRNMSSGLDAQVTAAQGHALRTSHEGVADKVFNVDCITCVTVSPNAGTGDP